MNREKNPCPWPKPNTMLDCVTLWNVNTQYEIRESVESKTVSFLNEEENKVLEFLKVKGSVTRADVENQLGVSASTALRLLRRMVERGVIVQHWKGRSIKYTMLKY